MYKRNDGITDQEILKNKFSAYIELVMVRYRMTYLRHKTKNYINLFDTEEVYESIPDTTDFVYDICASECISNALMKRKDMYLLQEQSRIWTLMR